ncbi:MAG TPA: 3'-5' exonuclease [Dysgonamonadaceae bacterium]|nr:3'-5' exonuclease [Dysgonamonadaceae bacterium]HOV35062.1 3'-5' exonuclease [Dysgonamonadaceae bacterium]HQG07562.1 3'-5' exonuclease [Dysgonamonadaceae bacterium]HQI42625.1 3'-5' exonuclease [Dysgonamonadaceae bacterium]
MGLSITKEQLNQLPAETFKGKIFVIDNEAAAMKAVQKLRNFSLLGFDTETRPSFMKGKVNKVALMQLASEDECYLFRLNKIDYPDALDEIICNPDIKKIGLSLRDDFAAIRKRSDKVPVNFVDLQQFVHEFGIDDNSLQKIYALVFGKRISKSQRLTNWEADQLTPAQQMYAAIDAWACVRIYKHLVNSQHLIK